MGLNDLDAGIRPGGLRDLSSISTNLSWETAADWDSATSESGAVHESVTNTDHTDNTIVKQGQSVASPQLSNNLVGYWPLHENSGTTAYGFGSVGVNGSEAGDPVVNTTATRETTGWDLDGEGTVHDHVSVPHDSGYSITGSVSVACWVDWRGANSTDTGQGILSKNAADASSGYGVFYSTQNNRFQSRINSTGYGIGGSLSTGLRHIVWTHDNGSETIYVDGTEEATTTTETLNTTNSDSLRIGCNRFSDTDGLNGIIQYVSLYDTALSNTDVQNLYDATAAQATLTTAKKQI